MTPPPETPRVEQRDREAAALIAEECNPEFEFLPAFYREGRLDTSPLCTAFAAHREASTLALSERVAELEAALDVARLFCRSYLRDERAELGCCIEEAHHAAVIDLFDALGLDINARPLKTGSRNDG